jgi:hypothetical protein
MLPTGDQNEISVGVANTRKWLFLILLLAPALIMAGKHPALVTANEFRSWFTLAELPKHMQAHVEYMLFVPLSAVVVAFFRLTLGMPVLSLFRPILTAIAFRIMGIPTGVALLVLVLGSILLIRPLLKGLHYYARVPVLLSIVCCFMVLPLFATRWWPEAWLQHLAYFPLISLALICEAFVKTLDEEGFAEAAWPTLNTIVVGVVISLIAGFHRALHLLVYYPELLVMQIGIVFFLAEYMHFELLAGKNPFLMKREQILEESRQLAGLSLGLEAHTNPQPELEGRFA